MDDVHHPGHRGCFGGVAARVAARWDPHFVEHGLAPDESVAIWQRRLDPVQQRLFGGCHLTRPIRDLVEQAGFVIKDLDVFYEKGAPKALGAVTLGVATT